MPPQPPLHVVLAAGSVLMGLAEGPAPLPTPTRPKDSLSTILRRRLLAFDELCRGESWSACGLPPLELGADRTEAQLKTSTADSGLRLLRLVAARADDSGPSTSSVSTQLPPVFGARDIKVISTLAGVVGRWGISARVLEGVLPATLREGISTAQAGSSQIQEIAETSEDEGLDGAVEAVLDTVLVAAGMEHTGKRQLAALVLPQLLVPLVGALVQLAFRRPLRGERAHASLLALFHRNTTGTVMASLLILLSAASISHGWLRPALVGLLSDQLLRTSGVRSLLMVVVGNEEDVSLSKLEMLGKLLGAKAAGMEIRDHLNIVVPQLLAVVQAASDAAIAHASPGKSAQPTPVAPPVAITRAACFVLSQLVDRYADLLEASVHPRLHAPFLPGRYVPSTTTTESIDPEALDAVASSTPALLKGLSLLSTLLVHSPPSPDLMPFLLSPIVAPLFSLSSYLIESKADPIMKDEVGAILETWGKAVPIADAVRGVIKAIELVEHGEELGVLAGDIAGRFYWARSEEGSACIRERRTLVAEDPLKLRIDAESVVAWIKEVERKELSSALFLRWLDEVQALRATEGFEAAKRSVMRLQLVLKMVDAFGSEILRAPAQIIAFVAHALDVGEGQEEAPAPVARAAPPAEASIRLFDLNIVSDDDKLDEAPEEDPVIPGLGADEIVMTALTLLLAVLEIDETLTMETTPLLSLIFPQLDGLASSTSELVPPLAREARLVLSLRKAAGYASASAKPQDGLSASRDRYQEALKLLQDPILPVRAQGLAILRALVASKEALLSTDPALLPAVLDIFIQAIEDEDSFLYLNAIQGLSSMVDVYGRQISKRLVEVYLGKKQDRSEVGEGEKGRRELDKRLRIAETLTQVIQRAGEAFAVFVDDVVPALLHVLRTSTLPVPLRASSLTLLATAVETAPVAVLPYSDSLVEACLSLLSLESRPLQPRLRQAPADVGEHDSDEEVEDAPQFDRAGKPKRPEETPNPIAIDSRHPSLRRAAILFLGLLLRTASSLASTDATRQERTYDSHNPLAHFSLGGQSVQASTTSMLVSGDQKRRVGVLLRYLSGTDEDSLVRHNAGAVLAELGA